MLDRWSVLDAGDPAAAALAAEAKTAIDNGRYDEADALLVTAQPLTSAATAASARVNRPPSIEPILPGNRGIVDMAPPPRWAALMA
jgi:hypothetical protein